MIESVRSSVLPLTRVQYRKKQRTSNFRVSTI